MTAVRTDSLDVYLREINVLPLLDDLDEAALGRRARAGDERAVDELVSRNLRFVVTVAKRFQHRGLSIEDLIGEGNVGLIAAARRFDPDQGVRFITYAVWWIRQAIAHAIVRQAHQVRLPANRVTAMARLSKTASALRGDLGREPTISELANRLGESEDQVRALQMVRRTEVSIDAPSTDSYSRPIGDELASADDAKPDDDAMRNVLTLTVAEALSDLAPRDREVLRLHFGLDGESEHTLDAIGERLGVTRERVRQLRDRALSRLRKGRNAAALASLTYG
jgi:RNA polymerase primary sigma factor